MTNNKLSQKQKIIAIKKLEFYCFISICLIYSITYLFLLQNKYEYCCLCVL